MMTEAQTRFREFAAGVPPLPTSLMAYSMPSPFCSLVEFVRPAPYPHDPIRYAEIPTYAGCEVLRGRMRAVVDVDLFDATSDRGAHDRDDEDGCR